MLTTTAKKIAKPLCAEFSKKYGAGWNLLTSEVKAALIFDRAVLAHVRVEPLKRAGYWPKPPVIKRETQRCEGCPRFVKRGGWLCPKCHEKETRKP